MCTLCIPGLEPLDDVSAILEAVRGALGKASIKDLQFGKRIEMHRDALCSAAIRVALEFLAALPIEEIEVLMHTHLLDRDTGHIQSLPVLHLRATSQALGALNLPRTQAPAVVERLGAHMNWSKREGFRAIAPAAFGIVPAVKD